MIFTSNFTGGPANTTQLITTDVATDLTSNPFTRTGYTFAGWTTNADGTGTSYTNSQSVTLTSGLTLHAKWTANSNNVIFTSNFTGGPANTTQLITTDVATDLTSNPFTRTGYTFSGWTANADGTGTSYTNSQSVTLTAGLTLHAKWTANSNTVTFKPNYSGGPADTTQLITTDVATNLTSNPFTRTGYTFSGWTTNANGSGTSYTNTQSVTLTSGLTLHAKWTANSNNVIFTSNFTGGPANTTQLITTDVATDLTSNPFTRTGYTFAGWTTNADGTGTSYTNSQSVTLTAGLTLHAKWTANPNTVTFKSNYSGGSADTTQSITSDVATNLTSNPFTRTGYTFAGWTTNADGTGTSYTNSQSVTLTAGLTLHAKWTAGNNVVTYDSRGGTTVANGAFATGESIASAPTAPTRTGYTFDGWSTSTTGAAISFPYFPGATTGITLYARWIEVTYSITYNVNGATGSSERTTDTYTYTGGAVALANVGSMAKTGYRFDGWAESVGGAKLTSPYIPTTNKTLYARWIAAQYTITYFSNSGDTAPNADTYTTAEPALVLPTQGAMSRTGYTFNGWSTTINNVATKIAGSETSATLTTSAPVNLYALWTAVNYRVTYSSENSTGGSAPTDVTNYNIGNEVVVKANSGTLVRTGYSFAGWTLTSGGSGTVYQSGDTYQVGSTSFTFYPKWAPNTYTITYSANGASGTPARTSDTYTTGGSTISLPNVGGMSRTGYNFAGWSVSSTGSVHVGAFTTTSDITLYAIWTIKSINYFYDRGAAGGVNLTNLDIANFPDTSAQSAQYNSTVTLSSNVDSTISVGPDDYKFYGWYDGNTTYSAGTSFVVPDATKTFTAQWVKLYGVRYALNGGTGIVARDPECQESGFTCLANQQITLSLEPTRPGYTFAGWRNQENTETKLAGASVTVTDNSYIWSAIWTAIPYTVTFNSVGGSNSPAQLTKIIGDTVVMPSPGTRAGYTFDSWLISSTNYGPDTSFIVGTSSVVFTAIWTPNRYTVSYNWNEGVGPAASDASYTVGNAAIALPSGASHSRDGYVFDGWSTTNGGASLGSTFIPTGNTLLYARWIDGAYTITYDNFNAAPGSSVNVTRATAVTLPIPTRTGFTFDGWYEDANYTLRYGAGGASVTPTASKTLIAKWVQNSLAGINPAHLNGLATLNIAGGSSGSWSGSHPQSSTGARLEIPAGALPNDTQVKVSFVEDLTRPANLISDNNAYFTSVVVHWIAGSGNSATVPTAPNDKPLVLTLTNPAIVAGAKVFSILAGEVTEVATATVDGEVTLTFFDDPEFVVAATKPGSPTAVTGTSGANAQSSVSWNAPLGNGGSAVTEYTVTASPGSATCTTTGTSCLVTGLTNGTPYQFTVTATNAIGTSLPSAASSAVTPRLALNYAVTFNSKGGSTVANGSFVENGKVSAPTDPTRSGYNFLGWSTVSGDSAKIVLFPYQPTSNANLTLYAIWRAKNSGGSGSTPTPTPSVTKSATPSATATQNPTTEPTTQPSVEPTIEPTIEPSVEPTPEVTVDPTATPAPSGEATQNPETESSDNGGIGTGTAAALVLLLLAGGALVARRVTRKR